MVSRSSAALGCLRLSLVVAVLITAHLQATETTSEPSAKILRISARAAAEVGDFGSAAVRLRDAARLSGDAETAEEAGRIAADLEGGSSSANYGPLIDLIQTNTGPPNAWDDEGGLASITPFDQGVFVGGPAMLASILVGFDSSHLDRIATAVRASNENRDPRQSSHLRLISLSRLRQHLEQLQRDGQDVSDDVHHLAGVSEIEYLFFYPETGDVVMGGPAADWTAGANGRVVSADNGRPVLQLDDLLVLSRTFAGDDKTFFRCSIDPKRSQVKAVQDFVRSNRRILNKGTARRFTQHLEDTLGLQNVIVDGIPEDSRIAKVIVEADYRMKLIGIGEADGAKGMKSYFDLLSAKEQRGSRGMDALRWWMTVGYEAVQTSPSGNVYSFAGNSVRCLSEDQIVNADGTRTETGTADGANGRFASLFTKHFADLTKQDAVFADLENIFDLAMVTALIGAQGSEQEVGLAAMVESSRWRHKPVDVPQELMTAAAHRIYRGRHIVVQVAGGVRCDVGSVVDDASRFSPSPGLTAMSNTATPLGHDVSRWWWDAAR